MTTTIFGGIFYHVLGQGLASGLKFLSACSAIASAMLSGNLGFMSSDKYPFEKILGYQSFALSVFGLPDLFEKEEEDGFRKLCLENGRLLAMMTCYDLASHFIETDRKMYQAKVEVCTVKYTVLFLLLW